MYVTAAIKRCIRKLLEKLHPDAPLGDPHNYQTLKDTLLMEAFNSRICNPDLSMLELRRYIKKLSKIHDQRYFQLFKILEANSSLTQTVIEQYLRLYKRQSDFKELNTDLRDIVNLVGAELQRRVNFEDGQILKQCSSISEAIEKTYENAELHATLNLLQPLLESEHDIIQRVTVSALLNSINNYAGTMATSLKQNKVPCLYYSSELKQQLLGASESKKIELLIVDVSPFLLRFAFNMLSTGLSKKTEVAYQLAFKVAKLFEKNCQERYDGKFLSQATSAIEAFIRGTLVNSALDRLESTESSVNRQLYVNLVLANSFLHKSLKESHSNIKIKETQVTLAHATQKKVLSSLGSDKEFVARYVKWADSLLVALQ